MKTKLIDEKCGLCGQNTKREIFKDVEGKEHSSLIRHMKGDAVCVKGSMTFQDLIGKQYIGEEDRNCHCDSSIEVINDSLNANPKLCGFCDRPKKR